MTFVSPSSGDRVGTSFIVPRIVEDLEKRRNMMASWARATFGMMGRTPDFLNTMITAMAQASDYFGQNRPEFKSNIERYYEYVRENDLVSTHTLLNIQRSRSSASSSSKGLSDIALSVVNETDALLHRRVDQNFGKLVGETAPVGWLSVLHHNPQL